jgi:hypothetical protein
MPLYRRVIRDSFHFIHSRALLYQTISGESMNPIAWYEEYIRLTQELRRLFSKCLFELSKETPNLGAVKAIRDVALAQYDKLSSHWKTAFPDETIPKDGDIRRHLRFAQDVDFRGLLSEDFFDAEEKAFSFCQSFLQKEHTDEYVSGKRIQELMAVSNAKFDLKKLIYICQELNTGYQSGQIYALPLLIRSILDHIPPIFGCRAFKEVANNYSGTKSFRDSAAHLEESSRKIGDAFLHTQVRSSETLPTTVQVDFRQSLDVVLGEIVRILQ